MGRLHKFPAKGIIVTHQVLTEMIILLTQLRPNGNCDYLSQSRLNILYCEGDKKKLHRIVTTWKNSLQISRRRKQSSVAARGVLPFRAPMVVVALNGRCGFLEADVVESSERCTADVLDGVIWDEELLLEAKTKRPVANRAFWSCGVGGYCTVLREFLPSTSWKCSPNSSDPRSQSHLSWTSLHTGRRPGTCPVN